MTLNSLTRLITNNTVKNIIDSHLISTPRLTHEDLIVESTGAYAFEGTCFDYCLRFLIQKQFNQNISEWHAKQWIAFKGLNFIPFKHKNKWMQHLEKSKYVVSEFIKGNKSYEDIAIASQYLSNMDGAYRGHFNPQFKHSKIITNQLIELMNDIPYEELETKGTIYLNPILNTHNILADADIIIGDTLIDIKTVKDYKVTKDHIRQLAGYYSLIANGGIQNSNPPIIKTLGIYFSRHKKIVKFDVKNTFKEPEIMKNKIINFIESDILSL